MGKTLYLECYSGISGDMTVAALLDLGADRSVLDRVLKSLKVSGFETKVVSAITPMAQEQRKTITITNTVE